MTEVSLSTFERAKLALAGHAYSLSRALGLRKLRDLLQSAEIATDTAVWLLGECYGESPEASLDDEDLTELLVHFQSIIWMTYRTQFTPIAAGDVLLRSDAGWGCTLRSGQMILAQALQRHWLGRGWRWPVRPLSAGEDLEGDSEPPSELCRLLQLFWDAPSDRNPLSIHNLCSYGRPCGVHPGKWLGPWVMCHALEAAASHAQQPLGLRVAVIAEPGGGAPLLSTSRFEPHFAGPAVAGGWEELGDRPGGGGGVAHDPSGGGQGGILLLVPLVLGLGKLNPVYVPQLQAVLRFPQSVGVVGGRPGSSLYFVGYQGANVLYLDPHDMQSAACSDGDWQSFHCDVLRTMPLTSIDPSLALGFYCRALDEYKDLCERLSELEQQSGGAPLLCVTSRDAPPLQLYDCSTGGQWAADELSDEEEVAGEEGREGEGFDGGQQPQHGEAGEPAAAGPDSSGDGHEGQQQQQQQHDQEGEEWDAMPEQQQPQQPQQQQGAGVAASWAQAAAGGGEATILASEGSEPLPLSPSARQASGKGGWELL